MAKLMASVCLAACLMVLLPEIARATDGSGDSDGNGISGQENVVIEESKVDERIEEIQVIEAIEESKRTRDQWETLAKYSIEKLNKKGASRMQFEQVQKHIETLRGAQEHQPDVSLTGLGMPPAWIDLLTLQERSRECSDDLIATVANYTVKGYKWQSNYALNYFGQYLSECGHEDQYKRAIDNFEQWDSAKYPTLDSYLRAEFFSHSPKYVRPLEDRLNWILSVFSELATNEIACNNQQLLDDFANLAFASRVVYPQLNELIKEYSGRYLHKCGLEESLKRALAEHEVGVEGGESTLDGYMRSEFFEKVAPNDRSAVQALLFALQIAKDSRHSDQKDGSSCNVLILSIKRRLANEYARKNYTDYSTYFSDVFADHSAACVNEFKARAKKFGQEESVFIEKLAKTIGDEIETQEAGQSRQVDEDKLRALRDTCKVLFEHMEPTIEALSYDYTAAKEDEEILGFMNYVRYCSFKGIDILPGLQKTVRDMLEELGVPKYPKSAEVSK